MGKMGNGEAAKHLYDLILGTANKFLHSAKHFTMEVLAEENPTYEEVADLMDSVGRVILALYDDLDPMMGQKAGEYCRLMKQMGIAIRNKDEKALSELVMELERKPFL